MPDLQITMANHISSSAAQSALSIQELVTTMKTAGMADSAIRQTLLNDLNTGGPLFGSFRNKLKNTVKNGVEASSNGSANNGFQLVMVKFAPIVKKDMAKLERWNTLRLLDYQHPVLVYVRQIADANYCLKIIKVRILINLW